MQDILNAYAQSNAHSTLPSLNHLNKNFQSSSFPLEPPKSEDTDAPAQATQVVAVETKGSSSRGTRSVSKRWTFDRKGLKRGIGDGTEEEHETEKMLSELIIELHRRVLWKKMIFSKMTPMPPQSKEVYAKQPG